jgi:hypothetical protein
MFLMLKDAQQYIDRINQLTPETQRKWGKMSVEQVCSFKCSLFYGFEPEKHKNQVLLPNFSCQICKTKINQRTSL